MQVDPNELFAVILRHQGPPLREKLSTLSIPLGTHQERGPAPSSHQPTLSVPAGLTPCRPLRTQEQHVVIDKTVCGTRTFDWSKSWTCDKLLPTLLPPGASLTVVQPDGTTLTYVGEEDPL
ncbi:DddA-like double-stranded DNA deaminase toxin [Kutzneria sp. CA-103260]|uniref:DddA-like double-stranded DNA deaminase toxin n=1 Tax=Kutzneria sp. CA-103260 TaxID=2802641 RepID=UPI003FA53BAB